MQEENKINVKKILLSLADHLNVDKLRGLAKEIGVAEGTLYAWVKRGKIGNIGAILARAPYINPEWLKTGEQPMMIIDEHNAHLLPHGARFEEANNYTEMIQTGENGTQAGRDIHSRDTHTHTQGNQKKLSAAAQHLLEVLDKLPNREALLNRFVFEALQELQRQNEEKKE